MLTVSPINLVRATSPTWFTIRQVEPGAFCGTASPAVDGAADSLSIELRISERESAILVAEEVPGTQLPACCPDRHLNLDGTFCVGYRAGHQILSPDAGHVWWEQLKKFIQLQRVAQRTRMWPPRQGLSHGDAGKHQIAAQEAAAALGIEEQYFEMLDGEPSWFSASFPRVAPCGTRLVNGRLPCPKGCIKKGRPILRVDCCDKQLVAKLVWEERRRKKLESEFWQDIRRAGLACCGTLRKCPLAAPAAKPWSGCQAALRG